MLKMILNWLSAIDRHPGDLSQHRAHSHKYEDMCM